MPVCHAALESTQYPSARSPCFNYPIGKSGDEDNIRIHHPFLRQRSEVQLDPDPHVPTRQWHFILNERGMIARHFISQVSSEGCQSETR